MFAIPYLILLAVFALLAILWQHYEDENIRRRIYWLCGIVFIFFFGFRGFVNYDWTSYFPYFTYLPEYEKLIKLPLKRWIYEPGFALLMVACKVIWNNYHFFVFVCCVLNTILLMRFLKRYTDNIPFAFIIYLCMGGFALSTDLLRNSLSIFIFLNAIPYLQSRKPLPYFAICAMATAMHSSALVYFPLYFVLNLRYNKWLFLSIFVVANLIFLLHIPIVKPTVSFLAGVLMPSTKQWVDQYLSFDANGYSISIGYLERLLTGTLLFCYFDKLRNLRQNNNIFVNSVFLYLVLFLLLSEFRTISVRVSLIFAFSYWVIWLDLIRCFSIRNNRRLFVGFIIFYCTLKTISSTNNYLSEYENVLLETKSYNERLLQFQRHFFDP